MHNQSDRTERTIGVVLLVLLLIGCLLVLRPFISAILWAVIFCFSSWPIHRRVLAAVRGRRTLAALVMTLGTTIILFLPLLLVGIGMADNMHDLTSRVRAALIEGPRAPPPWAAKVPLVGGRLATYWTSVARDGKAFTRSLEPYVQPALTWLMAAGVLLGRGLVELAMAIFIAFFLFRDANAAVAQLRSGLTRVAGDRGQRLLELAGKTVTSVVYGIFGTALVQGVMAGVGFLIAGVPAPGLLGLLTFFLSIVPMGPPLVWIPAALYLFAQGRPGWGIFMIVWGIGVSTVDNFIKPWLISRGSSLPFIIILFGVLGGALAFGFIGVFLGPTLLALCYSLVREWSAPRDGNGEAKPLAA